MRRQRLDILDSFDDSPRKRFDDVSLSVFVENELKQIVPQLYDRLYPELDARVHIPLAVDINPGAMAWAFDSYERRGQSEFISANPSNIPRADVGKKRESFPVHAHALGYGWTVQEIMAARFAGIPLDVRKANAAREGLATTEHQTLLAGDSTLLIPGFYTNPQTPIAVVPNGGWLTGATADQMVDDVNFLIDQPWIGSKRIHTVNTLLLPPAHFRRIQKARLPNTQQTVLGFILDTNPKLREVLPLNELATAGPGGAPRAVAYQKDPTILSGVVPQPFTQLPPQMEGMEVFVPCWASCGGTVWFYPRAALLGDGL